MIFVACRASLCIKSWPVVDMGTMKKRCYVIERKSILKEAKDATANKNIKIFKATVLIGFVGTGSTSFLGWKQNGSCFNMKGDISCRKF